MEAKHKLNADSDAAKHRYLDEAEENRGVNVGVWIVSSLKQNRGKLVRQLTDNRFVIAYDEEHTDIFNLALRFAVKYSQLGSSSEAVEVGDVSQVETSLGKARDALNGVVKIVGDAKGIEKSAQSIRASATTLKAAVQQALDEADAALAASVAVG